MLNQIKMKSKKRSVYDDLMPIDDSRNAVTENAIVNNSNDDSVNTSTNTSKINSTTASNSVISNFITKQLEKGEENIKFYDKYQQQNIWVNRDLVKRIDAYCKKTNRKKKDVYNDALILFLDIMESVK